MNKRRLSISLPGDLAALLDRAAANTGCQRNRLVIDALRHFLPSHVSPEANVQEDEERAFDIAREAMARGEYVTLDKLLNDVDGNHHASR